MRMQDWWFLASSRVSSQTLKRRRDEKRKAKAMNEATAILVAAGIDMKELNGRQKGRSANGAKKRGRKPLEGA
jgi:hypothetical protein